MPNSDRRAARRTPIALAVLVAIAAPVPGTAAGEVMAHAGAIALRDQLRGLMPAGSRARAPRSVELVTDCSDDGDPGTLRAVVAAAGEGDTVDLSQLDCSSITLGRGAIPVLLDDLTIIGPGASALAIDGAGADRVFVHPGGGTLTLQNLTVRHGAIRVEGLHVTGGGCIASAGYVVLDHSIVSDCSASAEGVYGGGIFAYGLSMYASTLARCAGYGDEPDTGTATFGGGAYAGSLTLVASTLSGNRAAHNPARSGYDIGGGAFSNSGTSIYRSTIEGNYSSGIGGGVATFGGTVDIVDSTISGNVARTRSGGGLDLRLFEHATIANSTVAGNQAASGGGVYLRGTLRSFSLQSTLLAGNSAGHGGADLASTGAVVIAGANNLVVAAGASVDLPPDTLNADPRLQPLAGNGGPTRTRALSPGSPALDTGNNAAGLVDDQRGPGYPRVVGAAPDIGAFERFVMPAPQKVPSTSFGSTLMLAILTAMAGTRVLRHRNRASGAAFTQFSPTPRHSSHM